MRTVNKITLMGNVGSDPDIRVTASGAKIAKVSLATNVHFSDEERTDWHRVNLWGRLADITESLVRKGDRIYIEGYLQYDSYEREGYTIPTAEIRAHELVFLGKAPLADILIPLKKRLAEVKEEFVRVENARAKGTLEEELVESSYDLLRRGNALEQAIDEFTE